MKENQYMISIQFFHLTIQNYLGQVYTYTQSLHIYTSILRSSIHVYTGILRSFKNTAHDVISCTQRHMLSLTYVCEKLISTFN
jgi:hypothetical protein